MKQPIRLSQRRAFTLIELLIVIAVIAILTALLFPVFAQVRGKARQAGCLSNFKQQALAVSLYVQDADEMMPFNYYGDGGLNSPPAMLFGQLLQPHLKNLQVYNCPSDPASDDQRATLEITPPNTPQQRDFNLSLKSNFGFNYQYLSPNGTRDGVNYISISTSLAQISSSAQTILAVDSVWDRDVDGNPVGGGSGSVDPPCRYDNKGADSFPASDQFLYRGWWGGWQPSHPKWGGVYGYAWPWHGNFVTVAFCDNHVKAYTITALAAGCIVRDEWGGEITDHEAYLWDLQ